MPVVMLAVAAVILGGVVVAALGRGGELVEFAADRPPFDPDVATAADVAMLRPPSALWGYSVQATDEAFNRIAQAVTERDVEIATLRRQLEEMTADTAAHGGLETGRLPASGRYPSPGRYPASGRPQAGQFPTGQLPTGQFSTSRFPAGQYPAGPYAAPPVSAQGRAEEPSPAPGPRQEGAQWPVYPGSQGGPRSVGSAPGDGRPPTGSRPDDGPMAAGGAGPASAPGPASGPATAGGGRLAGGPRPSAFRSSQLGPQAPGEQNDSWSAWERPGSAGPGQRRGAGSGQPTPPGQALPPGQPNSGCQPGESGSRDRTGQSGPPVSERITEPGVLPPAGPSQAGDDK